MLPSLYYFQPKSLLEIGIKTCFLVFFFWYRYATLLWHLSSAGKISPFLNVPLMGLIINATDFLNIVYFIMVPVWKWQDAQYLVVPLPCIHLEGPGSRFERSRPSWAFGAGALGCQGVDAGQCSWWLVLSVPVRCSKSAGALLMELLSAASHRINFVMRLHWDLWCRFWVR